MNIKIYQKEIDDGVGELVKSTASVAYCSPATVQRDEIPFPELKDLTESEMERLGIAKAENKDQIDLYYIESVLVSTGWNKNDDVFRSDATWAARNTPEDKQFNFMHDENDIIGHITGSYVLTKDGKAVADDDVDRPDEFDIITQAVLYNSWVGEDNRDRMGKIIAEIEEGKWYVSMECLFSGFDYAILDKEGGFKVVARDEDSAFLTKHLRSYGGTGEYDGHKIGRALSNISFSGKGLVSKPANPRSVILNNSSANVISFKENDNPKFSIGEFDMSDVLTNQISELKAELEASKAEMKAAKAQAEEAKDKEFAAQVAAFEATAEESQATIDTLNETVKSTQARIAELEDLLNASNTELASAMKEMDEMKKKAKMEKRKAALCEAGLDEEEVEETLASFEALDDAAFEAISAMMKKKAMKKYAKDEKKDAEAGMPPEVKEAIEKKKKEKEAKAEEVEEEVTPEAFAEVETSEASLVVSEPEDQSEVARAQVSEWFENHVLNK